MAVCSVYENNSHHPVVVHELNMSEHILIPYFKFMAAVLWEFWFPPPLHLSPSFLNYLTPAFQSFSLPCTLALHTLQGCSGFVCQEPFGVMTGIDCLFITGKHLITFDCIISTLAARHGRAGNVICSNPQAAALWEEGGEACLCVGCFGILRCSEFQMNSVLSLWLHLFFKELDLHRALNPDSLRTPELRAKLCFFNTQKVQH